MLRRIAVVTAAAIALLGVNATPVRAAAPNSRAQTDTSRANASSHN